MWKKCILLCITAITLISCNTNNCDVLCTSGPISLRFELLDKTTGENLFTNGTFNPDDIVVLDLDNNNSTVQHNFNAENDRNIIILGPFGWGTNTANYLLKVGETDIFTVHVEAEEIEGECCSRVALNKYTLEGAEYSQNNETGVYEVLVQL